MDKKQPEKMIYFGEQNKVASDDLTIFTSFALQSEPFMAAAVQSVDIDHFRPSETSAKLIYAIESEYFKNDDNVRYPRLTNWAFSTAQRTSVHIVALMQSNKAAYSRTDGEGERTHKLEDAKGAVEMVADCENVLGLTRPDWNQNESLDVTELTVHAMKVRFGQGGDVPLLFDKTTGVIEEPPTSIIPGTYQSDRLSNGQQTAAAYVPPMPNNGKPLKPPMPLPDY